MHLNIELYITTVDWTTGEYFVVSYRDCHGECVPPQEQFRDEEIEKKNGNILEIAQNIYEKAVNLDKNWCNIHLYDATRWLDKTLDSSELTLVYLAHIPYDVELKEPYEFLSTKELNNDYITESIRRIA